MPNPKAQKGQKDYTNWVLIAVGLIVLLVVGLWIKQKRYEARKFAELQKVRVQTPPRPAQTAPYSGQPSIAPQPELPTRTAAVPQTKPASGPNSDDGFHQQLVERSQETLTSFEKLARLHLDLPGQFQFINYDLQNGIASVYGYDDSQKTGVTAMAYPKDANPEQALEFLKQSIDDIPNTNGAQLTQISPPQSMPAPKPGSGLLGGTMWKAKYSDGRDVYTLFLRRQDKRGTYMFVYSGPPSYFQENGGALSSIYGQIRALPPEK